MTETNPKPELTANDTAPSAAEAPANPTPQSVADEMTAELKAALEGMDEEAIIDTTNASGDAASALNAENEKLTQDNAAMKDQLMRAVAETENIRKRSERAIADARKYAVTSIARDMVSVSENLKLALQNISEEARAQDDNLRGLAEGVEMTYNELLRVFGQHGITRLEPVGEKFDHNFHQAVAQVDDPQAVPGTIIQVLQAGYIIKDRLLRPAMVTVAKGSGEAPKIDTEA